MGLRAEFDATSPDLVLGPTLDAMPSLEVRVERQYALDPAHPIAFCWVRCADLERLERTLAADGTVDAFECVERTAERTLFRIRRSDTDVVPAYRRWVSAGGELLECRGVDGRWEVTMRFPDRESFARYHEFLEGRGVQFDLHRLETGPDVDRAASETLTESQREALVLAFEYGFFEVPRETGLSEIAAAFGISNQAVSERLRRGQARLIEEYVLPE